MSDFTIQEKKVFNAALRVCFGEHSASAKDLARVSGLKLDTVKGVMGSLVKKNMLDTFEDEYVGIGDGRMTRIKIIACNPIVNGEPISFGSDYYEEEEYFSYELGRLD